MKPHSLILKSAALFCGISTSAIAGDAAPPDAPRGSDSVLSDFNFCDWLTSKPGTVYKDANNPYIHEVSFSGRLHYNASYVDGEDVNGRDWNEGYSEFRRLRLGTKIGFLNYFGFKASANFVNDLTTNGSVAAPLQDLDWGYQDFDEASLSFDLKRAFELDAFKKLELTYGRIKWTGGLEARTSSNNLLTLERSALSNKLYDSARPTGLVLASQQGDWSTTLGIYSTDGGELDPARGVNRGNRGNTELLGGWNDGLMYNAVVVYKASDDLRFGLEFLYNGANKATNALPGGDDNMLPYKWATAFSTEYKIDPRAGINAELFYGDNGNIDQHAGFFGEKDRQGGFGGIVVTPYYWLIPDKLQAVAQYSYAVSEEDQGIRSNSRYFRASGSGPVNSGRGNELQSIYGGLNWLLCGENLRLQAGVQYETLQTPYVGTGEASAISYLFGVRSYF